MEIARSLNYLLYVSNFSLGSSGQPVQRDVSRLGNDLLFASGDQVRHAGSALRVQGGGGPERCCYAELTSLIHRGTRRARRGGS